MSISNPASIPSRLLFGFLGCIPPPEETRFAARFLLPKQVFGVFVHGVLVFVLEPPITSPKFRFHAVFPSLRPEHFPFPGTEPVIGDGFTGGQAGGGTDKEDILDRKPLAVLNPG
jgi:hypothetical protein